MWKKVLLSLFGVVVFGLLFIEGHSLWREKENVQEQYDQMRVEVLRAKTESGQLSADLEYLSIPDNFEKEIRSRFNFHFKDEKTIIVVPIASTGTASSSGG